MPNRSPKNLIGPNIRKLRLKSAIKVTQEDLAARVQARGIDLERSALARIESQRRLVKDIEILAISAALRVPIEKLFGR